MRHCWGRIGCMTLAGLLVGASAAQADLPVDRMRAAIGRGVDVLIAAQEADGSWKYDIDWVRGSRYDVGMTSLCTLALAHTRLPKASAAVQKGLAYITQHKPEPTTYTAGLVEMVLFENGGVRHRKLIDRYAWMTVVSQKRKGVQLGSWGYRIVDWPGRRAQRRGPLELPGGRSDHSNSQFGVLALWYAQRAGYQVPEKCWERVKKHYEATQNADGGWSYTGAAYNRTINRAPQNSYLAMTVAGTVSLYLADEALASQKTTQCRMRPENPAVEKGLKWIADRGNLSGSPYTWYALERLGIMTGRSEFGGKNWMELGTEALLRDARWTNSRGGQRAATAFAVLFLARALEPVIINKLKRKGDWNNDPYDIKKLTEYISIKFQYPKQWRVVTLDASVDELLKVPILYMNGHQALEFTDGEKQKLKQYVDRGGTIFGMACCSRKAFDESFRALVKELWPEGELAKLPKAHSIYTNPRPLVSKPKLLGLADARGRLGVIYAPNDMCCRWTKGGPRAKNVFDVGANIYFYVAKEGVKIGGVREGQHAHTAKGD